MNADTGLSAPWAAAKKPARKRKASTELKFTEQSKRNLQERLQSEEGQRCLDEFAKLIVDWAIKQMPLDLMQALVQEKGHETFKELWPDIVNAYFRMLCPPPKKYPKKAIAASTDLR